MNNDYDIVEFVAAGTDISLPRKSVLYFSHVGSAYYLFLIDNSKLLLDENLYNELINWYTGVGDYYKVKEND